MYSGKIPAGKLSALPEVGFAINREIHSGFADGPLAFIVYESGPVYFTIEGKLYRIRSSVGQVFRSSDRFSFCFFDR